MNRNTISHEITLDENSNSSELRLKLSNAGWEFLRVVTVAGRVLAYFEEVTSERKSNYSFFIFRDQSAIRCRADYQWLDTLVLGNGAFHIYGHPNSDR